MTAIVPIMVVPAILFAVNPVILPVVPLAIGINNPPWCRFYHYNTWRRGGMIIPVTIPVAIVIARIIGTIGTG